jgi:hypothetical protein
MNKVLLKTVTITSKVFKSVYALCKNKSENEQEEIWLNFYLDRGIPVIGTTIPPEPSLIFEEGIDCEMEMKENGIFEFKVYKYEE